MKAMKQTSRNIEFEVWQLFAIVIAGLACLFSITPLILKYRIIKCDNIYVESPIAHQSNISEEPILSYKRYARSINDRAQCGVIPPLCSATTTVTPMPTPTSIVTTRSTASTVKVTRPVITNAPTTSKTTTPDPWANSTRPHDSWRLPSYAKPIDYSLSIACPDCFSLRSNSSEILFNGQVTIRINILNNTESLVLHAKNLKIIDATIISGGSGTAVITHIPEFDMIHLRFAAQIAIGEISLKINYTGIVNERDQTGFYRELFWKSLGELSYLVAGNFLPIHARKAFPCFDEPSMQATFSLTIESPENSTIALSNNPVATQSGSTTTFSKTESMSTFSLAWAILPTDEFTSVEQTFPETKVKIWIRPELVGKSNGNVNWTFELVGKTLEFVKDYLKAPNLPSKIDMIGIPDLILDEKASTSWGLLTFREEFLSVDFSLQSAERIQATTKTIVEHILQMWFSNVDWWDNLWFGKSLSSFLAYKMIEMNYPTFKFMEQFPVREMVPLMMNDFKPKISPVSNKNLASNDQILDYISTHIYSKGASILRLLEYIAGEESFQTAVNNTISVNNPSDLLDTFYSSIDIASKLNTSVTTKEFARSWTDERNYPIVNVDFIPSNDTNPNITINFRQTRYFGSFSLDDSELNPNYTWLIYMECDLGGKRGEDVWNLTENYEPSKLKFLFQSTTHTIQITDNDYLWIKCNKDFYSYYVSEYVSYGEEQHELWQYFELLFNENLFSNNDRADLLNDAFILPHGGEIVTYTQTINLVRELYENPSSFYTPWSVFVWHWNYLMGIEEHSQYFWNFKQFATLHILASYNYNVDELVSIGNDHQERLVKSMLFELLCRVQNPDALNKATELFRLIPREYFVNSTSVTGVPSDILSTVIYYHIQNSNDMNEWEYLWINLTENQQITSQQRSVFLRGLSAAKEIWRLKFLLEYAMDTDSNVIESQEFFDIIISISENPNGRDVIWNFYRHNYRDLIARFGETNRLFNQLIMNIVQSFENEYYYFQMEKFIEQYPSSSTTQRLAFDQIIINFEWIVDGMAESLDDALSGGDRNSKKKNN